jgi:predicted alpha/beta hydrolase family esterase
MSPQVLILPGWQGSGPEHWQMRWVTAHGYTVVEQSDWMRPLRGDWLTRLDEVVGDSPVPVVLAAHSLGCIQVAAWARVSRHVGKVQGALLVAPGDVEQPQLMSVLRSWTPIERQRLPFKAVLVGSENDPYCSLARAQGLAQDWGAQWVNLGACGHINAESGLGDWPAGHALLQTMMKE